MTVLGEEQYCSSSCMFFNPRYKMKVIKFYYGEILDDYRFGDLYEFNKVLQKLYDLYASIYTPDVKK